MALVQVDLTSPDLNWNFVFVAIWSAIEYDMAIVCGETSKRFVSPFHYLLIGTQLVYRPFGQSYLWSQVAPPVKTTTLKTSPTTKSSPSSLQKEVEARPVTEAIESPQKRARANVVLYHYLKEELYQRLLQERRTPLYGNVVLEKISRCKEKKTQVRASMSVVI